MPARVRDAALPGPPPSAQREVGLVRPPRQVKPKVERGQLLPEVRTLVPGADLLPPEQAAAVVRVELRQVSFRPV
ncbi:hypothetical protein NSE01_31530 [Novosphingobium sediminis]|uniref:Uncharacterized protein n=1 Tax=Novosphingobium sediminis TaxID=707214 RepID=A0A512ANQ3_9SPHN|nr:hypothetical protein NSE01_31530 [Novosphingobium sediminis]